MMSLLRIPVVLLLAIVPALPGWGEEAAGGSGGDEVRYVALQPAFVTNFGFADRGKLLYLKTDVSIRVSSQAAEMAARYHLPALRNALVLLLSRQDEATVSTGRGREVIRTEALAQVQAILAAEEGEPYVDDLMFTNFIVQR